MIGVAIVILLVLLVLWILKTQQSLTAMEENVNSAMNQIGVQLSSRFDALAALLDATQETAASETQTLMETIRSCRRVITSRSSPDDVRTQETLILDILIRLSTLAEAHPEWKSNENYLKCMSAVDSYGKMVCTSRLIYNDSVAKRNRAIRMFPTSLAAGILGFRPLDYLEAAEEYAVR